MCDFENKTGKQDESTALQTQKLIEIKMANCIWMKSVDNNNTVEKYRKCINANAFRMNKRNYTLFRAHINVTGCVYYVYTDIEHQTKICAIMFACSSFWNVRLTLWYNDLFSLVAHRHTYSTCTQGKTCAHSFAKLKRYEISLIRNICIHKWYANICINLTMKCAFIYHDDIRYPHMVYEIMIKF